MKLAEGAGFEPASPFRDTRFRNELLKPLGQPSKFKIVRAQRDSNPQPQPPQGCALSN